MKVEINKFEKGEIAYLPINELSKNSSSDDIYLSWLENNFNYLEKNKYQNGLRSPQLGALFSALGYLKTNSNEAATIVMPTGTGKTETMLSLVVAGHFKKTLIIVPSDALRQQTKNKFINLGYIRTYKLVPDNMLNPRVMIIDGLARNIQDIEQLKSANVIITTVASLNLFTKEPLDFVVNSCTHLIVDEAHHVEANKWARIKSYFSNKPIFQFTATPFRSDGKRVDGRVIFEYPIEQAQKDGYFKEIEFYPVKEFDESKSDLAIANTAINLLKSDLNNNLDHILMARVSSTKRANEVFKLYEKFGSLNPVIVHTKIPNYKNIIKDIKDKKHRIIVCVNMLGEGFDLPELKIAAIHDTHKGINITLQFTGRFTRQRNDLGNAKFVANIAEQKVNDAIESLYKEDSDWNKVIRTIGEIKVSEVIETQKFKDDFDYTKTKLLDLGLSPKVSTVIYKTKNTEWTPENFIKIINKSNYLVDKTINKENTILIFSLKTYNKVNWSFSEDLMDIIWELYIVYFDKDKKLLYIHSSGQDTNISRLAKFITEEPTLISGDKIFRTMYGIKRMKLQNVGLNKANKNLRFMMYTGSDTKEAIPELITKRAIKSNIFSKGFENGIPMTLGCSHKGKIWSMSSDSVHNWIKWCDHIGNKILNDNIDTNDILKTAMQSEFIKNFPSNLIALNLDWPIELIKKSHYSNIYLIINGNEYNIHDCQLELISGHLSGKSITFNINIDGLLYPIKLLLSEHYKFSSQNNISLQLNNKSSINLCDYFNEYPPSIFLSDTSMIEGNQRFYCEENYQIPIDISKFESWKWEKINLSKESQRDERREDSIQYYTIKKIFKKYDIIFDDDGAGESADIVAFKIIDEMTVAIDFFHCKYCPENKQPSSRVDDIYQVSGQAMKGIKWINDLEELYIHLKHREKLKIKKEKPSRFDKGTIKDLDLFFKRASLSKVRTNFFIVQPAISVSKLTDDVKCILGATEIYIKETTGSSLKIIASD
ncbi:DEAD/DEAH box helicase family protein [Proteus faecis]|uniref:DEAD/DEAH box helicase family protein n=1 Tax=Proteus faecis TaxID=2050967 RepID=UPI0018C5AF49|nr:DEAD/DEAH box helicase family protein [Proteus mirabilis]